MGIVTCDHCNLDFELLYLLQYNPKDFIAWCKDCILQDRELLIDAGISASHIYKSAYWVHQDRIKTLKSIPKRKSINSNTTITQPIPIAKQETEVQIADPPICSVAYYGCGVCSCGKCKNFSSSISRDVFGYNSKIL